MDQFMALKGEHEKWKYACESTIQSQQGEIKGLRAENEKLKGQLQEAQERIDFLKAH